MHICLIHGQVLAAQEKAILIRDLTFQLRIFESFRPRLPRSNTEQLVRSDCFFKVAMHLHKLSDFVDKRVPPVTSIHDHVGQPSTWSGAVKTAKLRKFTQPLIR